MTLVRLCAHEDAHGPCPHTHNICLQFKPTTTRAGRGIIERSNTWIKHRRESAPGRTRRVRTRSGSAYSFGHSGEWQLYVPGPKVCGRTSMRNDGMEDPQRTWTLSSGYRTQRCCRGREVCRLWQSEVRCRTRLYRTTRSRCPRRVLKVNVFISDLSQSRRFWFIDRSSKVTLE